MPGPTVSIPGFEEFAQLEAHDDSAQVGPGEEGRPLQGAFQLRLGSLQTLPVTFGPGGASGWVRDMPDGTFSLSRIQWLEIQFSDTVKVDIGSQQGLGPWLLTKSAAID